VTTAFRNTIGLPGRLSVRLQPNHPTDDPQGVAAATLTGCCWGRRCVIGVNPATDNVAGTTALLHMLARSSPATTFQRKAVSWRT